VKLSRELPLRRTLACSITFPSLLSTRPDTEANRGADTRKVRISKAGESLELQVVMILNIATLAVFIGWEECRNDEP
jgi:hypothetical protein